MREQKLSIVQLHSYDYGGGAETVARLNHHGLMTAGHSSQLFVAVKKGSDTGVEEIRYRRGFPGSRRIARKLEALTGLQYTYSPSFRFVSQQFREKPDVVHLHSLHGAEGWADLRGVAALSTKFPVVCSMHDLWLLSGHCAHPIECDRWKIGCGLCPDLERYPSLQKDGTRLNWSRKLRLFKTHKLILIAPSQWVKSQAEKSPILKDCAIRVIPNPIDTEVFTTDFRDAARRRLGIPEDKLTVLLAANDFNCEFKGMGHAVQVLNGLAQETAFAILVGQNSAAIGKQVTMANKAVGKVHSSAEMADYFRAADVVLMPSKVETFGLVAGEATACGSVVVSYRAGGLHEVTKTVGGIVVDDGDVKGMLEATRFLLRSGEEREKRVATGKSNISRLYSLNAHVAGCVEVYQEAIAGF